MRLAVNIRAHPAPWPMDKHKRSLTMFEYLQEYFPDNFAKVTKASAFGAAYGWEFPSEKDAKAFYNEINKKCVSKVAFISVKYVYFDVNDEKYIEEKLARALAIEQNNGNVAEVVGSLKEIIFETEKGNKCTIPLTEFSKMVEGTRFEVSTADIENNCYPYLPYSKLEEILKNAIENHKQQIKYGKDIILDAPRSSTAATYRPFVHKWQSSEGPEAGFLRLLIKKLAKFDNENQNSSSFMRTALQTESTNSESDDTTFDNPFHQSRITPRQTLESEENTAELMTDNTSNYNYTAS